MTCNCNNQLRIVEGNAFGIKIAVEAQYLDGTVVSDFSLADSEATLTIVHNGISVEKAFTVEDNTAVVLFDGTEGLGWYDFAMSGTWEGKAWRWAVENVFQIVSTNAKANIPDWVFYTDDTYHVGAVLTLTGSVAQVQADWTETDTEAPSYIKNKPDVYTKTETDQQIKSMIADDTTDVIFFGKASAVAPSSPSTGALWAKPTPYGANFFNLYQYDGTDWVWLYGETLAANGVFVVETETDVHFCLGGGPGSCYSKVAISQDFYNKSQMDTLLGNKVDKVAGMGLSENNFTNTYKKMLDNPAIADIGEVECWQDSQWIGSDIDDVLIDGIYKFVATDADFDFVKLPSILIVLHGESGVPVQLLIGGTASSEGTSTFYRFYNSFRDEWFAWHEWLVRKEDLATVATTGSYTDLSNTPTIPDSADDISYDNTTSGLSATNVQAAIDEVAQGGGGGGGGGATVNDMLKALYINYDERPATDTNRCKFNSNTGYFEMNGLTDLTFDDMAAVYRAGNNAIPYLTIRGPVLKARTNYSNGMSFGASYLSMGSLAPNNGDVEVLNLGAGIYLSNQYAMFYSMPTIQRVLGVVNFNNASVTYLFSDCDKLTYVQLKGISNSFNIFGGGTSSSAMKITYDCFKYIVDNASTVSSKTLVTNATLYSYLTGTATPPETTGGTSAQWQQLLTDLQTKGWTVASE